MSKGRVIAAICAAVAAASIAIHIPSRATEDITHIQWVEKSFGYDTSTAAKGYIIVSVRDDEKYALILSCASMTESFVSLPEGVFRIPVAMGNGTYDLLAARKIKGTSYEVLKRETIRVTSEDSEPYLTSTYMVSWDEDSSVSQRAQELAEGRDVEAQIAAICSWIYGQLTYDSEKADLIRNEGHSLAEHIPDPEGTLKEKKGICLDYAALAAAMMRSAGIPARLTLGDYEGKYHAWVEAWADGTWLIADPVNDFTGAGTSYQPAKYY